MSSFNIEPVVQIHPSVGHGDMVAFVNENFRKLNDGLKNVLKIVSSGSVTISKAANVSSETSGAIDVPDAVAGEYYQILAYVNIEEWAGTSYDPIQFIHVSATTGAVDTNVFTTVIDGAFAFNVTTPSWSGNTEYTSARTYNIKYFILHQTI